MIGRFQNAKPLWIEAESVEVLFRGVESVWRRYVEHLEELSSRQTFVESEELRLAVAFGRRRRRRRRLGGLSENRESVLDGRRIVLHDGGELDVEMGGEPIRRPHLEQQVLEHGVAQRVLLDLGLEERLVSNERFVVAVVVNASGPVVRDDDVDGLGDLLHAKHFQVTHVVRAPHRIVRVWRSLEMTAVVVVSFPDARQA